jgi:general secretion pathway protein M
MSEQTSLQRMILRSPRSAACAYVALVLLLIVGTWSAVADILDRRADVAAARDIIDQLQGRKLPARNDDNTQEFVPSGSPALEGPTVTVAGAALLQRVIGAITKVGGNVLSSQVELQGPQSKAGFIGVIASCELDQPSLQKLLYDLEAGMPFLFVDQLAVQAPVASSTDQEGRMRVLLAVSGQWQGTK